MADEYGYTDPAGSDDFRTIMDNADPNAVPGPLTLDYYRNKVGEFQNVLNQLDPVYWQLQTAVAELQAIPGDEAQAMMQEGYDLLGQYESKRSQIVTVAETINLGSAGLNALGVEFPQVQTGLAVAPAVMIGGAVLVAAAIITWGRDWIRAISDFAARAQKLNAIASLPADQQGAAMTAFINTEAAAKTAQLAADQSPISAITGAVKWVAVAGLAFLAYQAWKETR